MTPCLLVIIVSYSFKTAHDLEFLDVESQMYIFYIMRCVSNLFYIRVQMTGSPRDRQGVVGGSPICEGIAQEIGDAFILFPS
jgi:hypothetical protein